MKKNRVFLMVALFFGMGVCAFGQTRYALVIGNSGYKNVPALKNPVNDAKDVAAALKSLGYQVDLKTDIDYHQFIDAVDSYISRLSAKQENEGFFWFAGHGVQIKDENYLLPIDVSIASESRVQHGSYSLNELLAALKDADNKANVVILDACRNNPLPATSRSAARGLAVVNDVPKDLFVMFSTAPGDVAQDGDAGKRNSPFAEAFLRHIDSTEPIPMMAADVIRDTASLTANRQQPFYRGSIISDKYYALNKSAPSKPSAAAATGSIAVSSEIAGAVLIDGAETGSRVKAQGSVTVSNVSTGETEVAVRGENGVVVKATVVVRAGETASAQIKRSGAAASAQASKPATAAQPAAPKAQLSTPSLPGKSSGDSPNMEIAFVQAAARKAASGPPGSVKLTSEIAGTVWIDGSETKTKVKAQKSVTLENVPSGNVRITVKTAKEASAPVMVKVEAGKTVSAFISAFLNTPPWLSDLPPEDSLWGIGIAKMSSQAITLTVAENRARTAISRQLIMAVREAIADYCRDAGLPMQASLQLTEEVSGRIANMQISGARPIKRYIATDGTCWFLVEWKKSAAANDLAQIFNSVAGSYPDFRPGRLTLTPADTQIVSQ